MMRCLQLRRLIRSGIFFGCISFLRNAEIQASACNKKIFSLYSILHKFNAWYFNFYSMKIVAFTGSLRKGSFNHGLLVAAQELAPAGVEIEIVDPGSLPLFNQDLEANLPQPVVDFKAKVKAADAVLIATPEYNYSIPGVLKNALDWCSRPYGNNSLDDKPAAIMGASGGMTATARSQYHLRQVFVFLNVHALNRPEVMVPTAADKFDADGKLTDQKTRDKVKECVEALVVWHDRLKK